MTFHISEIRAIRLFVSFVIPSADFITNYAFGRMTRILTGYFLASPFLASPYAPQPGLMDLRIQNMAARIYRFH
jgi:hypothetical protein